MPTTVNLSVGSGETKNLTFNCGGTFVTDDIEFVITGSGGDTNTTLSGIAYCSTGASTTAKVATMPGFALSSGQRIILYLSTTNSKASATLNVNSTGAKTIKIGGANTTTSNFTAGYWICNYDGTNWVAEKMDNSKIANGAGYTTNTGTVTSVGLSNATNGGLTISGSPITGSGSITVGHSNVLSSAQSTQAVYPITIDKNGHIASYGTAVTIPAVPSNIVNTITTSAGTHSTISSATGNVSFNVPTNTSHLTNDSGFLTSHQTIKVDGVTGATTSHYCYCNTAAGTQDKVITFANGTHTFENGLRIIVKFKYTNTHANPRFKFGSTTYNIYYKGTKVTSTSYNEVLQADSVREFIFDSNISDKIGFYFVGDLDTNTNSGGTVTSVGISNGGGLTVSGSPITGSGTITVGHSNSAITAGTNVGNNTTTSLSHGGTFVVPYFSYDTYGHITGANTKTLTLPSAAGDSDIHTGVAYCSTAANTGAKEAMLPGFSISYESPFKTHSIILFVANTNTYSGNCTLNVNGIGAMGMKIWNGSSWSTVSGNMLKSGYYFCYYDGNSNSEWYLIPMAGGGDSGSIVCTDSASSTTNTAVSSGDVYINYVEGGSVVSSIALHGMGGTTITSAVVSGYTPQIRISSTTGGGGGGAEYLNDLYDVYTSPYNGQFLQYNGSGWTGAAALTQITAGSGLNATSGNTTNDGGSITASTSGNNNPPVTSTGTIHLTRVNTNSSYNDGNNNTLTKVAFGPTANKTVTSNSNTFNVPYYKVDKFGRVTDSISRTITINGLGGGGGGGSTVSAVGSESQTNGYKVGSITIDGGTTYFTVSPARAVTSGGSSSGEFSFQGVVRPISEVTMSDMQFTDIDGGNSWYSDEINGICKVACAPDFSMGGVFLPITMLYHFNYITYRWESVPYLFVPSGLAEAFTEVYKEVFDFPK